MADISSITLPGGGTYYLKDKNAVPKYGMGKNLLDNWYFGNPVNQRGQSSYTSSGYTIDRWKKYSEASTSGSVSLSAGGVVLTGSSSAFCMLRQDVNDYQRTLGKTVTISALTSAGLIQTTGTIPAALTSNYSLDLSFETGLIQYTLIVGTEFYFGIRVSQGNTMTVYAVKLEVGTQQTLAHLEDSTWVLNEIPNYEEELIKCQTSTAESTDTYANKSLATEQQLAYPEFGTTASRNYTAGEYICWNGLTYTADTNIATGTTLSASGGNKNLTECVGGGFNDRSTGTVGRGTMTSGTILSASLVRWGRVVVCTCQLYGLSGINRADCVPFRMPEGFRPSSDTNIQLVFNDGNNGKQWITYGTLKSDGYVSGNNAVLGSFAPNVTAIQIQSAVWLI